MSWLRFFHRARRDVELAKDIQFYLDTETEENVARGMPGMWPASEPAGSSETRLTFARRITACMAAIP